MLEARAAAGRLPTAARRPWVLTVLLMAWGLPFVVLGYHPGGLSDWNFFELATRSLIGFTDARGHQYTGGLHVYVEYPNLQFGAPAMVALLPVQWIPYSVSSWIMLVVMLGAVAVTITWTCQSVAAKRGHALVGGALVMALSAYYLVGYWRHLDDVLALLALAGAMRAMRDGRAILVGACLGTAASAKPWAIVAAPVLLGLAREQRVRAVLALLVTAGIWWGPFVIAAPDTVHALSSFSQPISPGSGAWALGLHNTAPTWLRATQLELGIAVAAFVALRRDWRRALLAGLAIRMVLDPYAFSYYGAGPLLAALAVDTSGGRRQWLHLPLATAVFYVVPWVFGERSDVAGVSKLVWGAATILVLCRPLAARYRVRLLTAEPATP